MRKRAIPSAEIIIEGNKKVSRDTMLFYMKSKEQGPFSKKMLRDDFKTLWNTAFSYFNPSRMKRVEKIILDLLQDKGFNQGKVNISTTEDTEKRQVSVVIDVVQGPKTRIAEVVFPGLEFKVYVPMLNVPFRLIFAYNPRVLEPGDSHFAFRFAVGTSFQ